MRHSTGSIRWLTLLGAVAAVALAVRGTMELRSGSGWPMLLIAAALATALALRERNHRD